MDRYFLCRNGLSPSTLCRFRRRTRRSARPPATFGIGDLNPQFYLAPKTKPGALIWGVAAQFLFPTGSPSTLSAGKYGLGLR